MNEFTGALDVGTTIAHYRVIRRLGAGGMGEVYLAHDSQLRRDVALKVLPAEALGDATERARLAREARLASALNHPNICTIYEVGEEGGRAYIAMEAIEGRTLDQAISAHGLPAESVARIGAAIAAALAHAHRRGIVHRDLKSVNVMIGADGRVKLMDFGLARSPKAEGSGQGSGATRITSTGVVMGSPQYMAPEVLRGDPADARSDLWALGVVLHEMCTGSLPFQGRSTIELGAAILNAHPALMPASVPAGLRMVVQRCLTKEPSQRFQLAEEVRAVLETVMSAGPASVGSASGAETKIAMPAAAQGREAATSAGAPVASAAGTRPRQRALAIWITGAIAIGVLALVLTLNQRDIGRLLRGDSGAGHIRSLAVLPLQNLSRDPEQEYFADGMTEELIASLAGLEGVSVISRTSVMKYKGTTRSLPQIARELGVDGVIEGSAMNAGGRVRITAQLIEAAHDRHLWANHYERDLKDVLTLQDDVAQAIAGEIRVALTPAAEARHRNLHAVDPAAYEACLRGRYLWNKRTPEGLAGAIDQFKRAIRLDSTYALAFAGLAQSYVLMPLYANWSPDTASVLTRAAAVKALALDEGLAEAHTALAQAKLDFDWDWSGAGVEFRRALELNPSDATTHQWYANYLLYSGHAEEGRKQAELALKLDPLSLIIANALIDNLISTGHLQEADARLTELLKLDPGFPPSYLELFILAEAMKDYPQAIEAAARFQSFRSGSSSTQDIDALRQAYAARGERGYWTAMVKFTEKSHRLGVAPLAAISRCYVRLGDYPRALDLLEQSTAAHESAILGINSDQMWNPLHADPRFQALLQRIGLSP
ncbi:MAG: protein kinase [Candidatus Eisenbacteria bacterium]|nr:protein kinase [Candidatus Eisenbacteria bacterium]